MSHYPNKKEADKSLLIMVIIATIVFIALIVLVGIGTYYETSNPENFVCLNADLEICQR